MTVSSICRQRAITDRVPISVQIAAWIVGLTVCVVGMLDLIAEWSPGLALIQFLLLAVAPILFMVGKPAPTSSPGRDETFELTWIDWCLCLLIGAIALTTSGAMGAMIGDLPPAYHDEYSYLFQARTLLAGRFSFPSSAVQPELFDQMHVLNEGRMASRYYPGTGLWLAPFVAIGHPYLAPMIAGAIATMLIYWVAVELGGRWAGVIASLAMAVSPGVGLFSNMLLAHLPTLLGLSIFLLGMVRWRRTRSAWDAWSAGWGLSFAMLCRPMTAAGFGLPFGIDAILWLIAFHNGESRQDSRSDSENLRRQRASALLGLGLPLVAGWIVMLVYNHSVTGSWFTSPYQMYTDVYTPRHVYGFNNVIRGERHLGPRVIDDYDRWAQNLTPALAAENVLTRTLASWLWTFDLLPLAVATAIVLVMLNRMDRRWLLLASAAVSLHSFHVPYWYVGIMGWHYVFETAPIWCLFLGGATTLLISEWRAGGKRGLVVWWLVFLFVSIAGAYAMPGERRSARGVEPTPSRFVNGLNSLAYPRRKHAEFRKWLDERIDQRPAIVLLEQGTTENTHMDPVVNNPGLDSEILVGRFRPAQTELAQVQRDFPNRQLYLVNLQRHTIRHVQRED